MAKTVVIGSNSFSGQDFIGHLLDQIDRDVIGVSRSPEAPASRLRYKEREDLSRYRFRQLDMNKDMDELLGTFTDLRAKNIGHLRAMNLTEEQFSLTGIHPELGRVTLGNLLATWVCHDLNHTHQIAKSMVYQYRDNVGPWRAYISLMPK